MNKEQIEHILKNCSLPDSCEKTVLKTTHISWVMLTDNYAFKIKRPVNYTFLDFSSVEKRKLFCHEEVRLNKRLAPDMYLGVIAVTSEMAGGEKADEVIDYAVQMKRMDNGLEMDNLLAEDKISKEQIDRLAKKIVTFHRNARPVKNAFDTPGLQKEVADIKSQKDFLTGKLGKEWEKKVNKAIDVSYNYLNSIRDRSNERVISGFRRDCHGDLNSRNIFLYEDPVIFDCIEFNKSYREIDILNDIAFLCMDLDFYEREDLAVYFYDRYLAYYPLDDDPRSRKLFTYYKSYRANIRAKVNLLKAANTDDNEITEEALNKAKRYIELMDNYTKAIA